MLGMAFRRRSIRGLQALPGCRCSSTNSSLSADAAKSDRAARRQRWSKEKEGQGGGVAAPASQPSQGGSKIKFVGGAIVLGSAAAYYAYSANSSDKDGDSWDSFDATLKNSPLAGPYTWIIENFAMPFINPSRDKLLPDWHSIPNIPPDSICPHTLVLDLEDTLVHATWDPKYGWRYAKRPGVDQFLLDLSKYYEVVLFSPSNFGVVDPITWTLDKNGCIMHRLYKDSTRFFKGKHVKDLSRLNRDLKKVIIVDDDEEAFMFQPDNGIKIKKFVDPKDKSDRSLDNLKKFLIAIIMEGVQDVPAVLRQFKGMDADQIYESYQRRLTAIRAQDAEKRAKGLGGLLRAGGTNTIFKPIGSQQQQPRLSSKDIVGGVMKFDEEKEALASAEPAKKGKYWQAYQDHLKELEEDQRRKLEVWQTAQAKREEERRKAMAGRIS